MDERVERAMQQWPDVPDVYGWLSLDARGRWKLRGEDISNPNLIAFINRNYARTAAGGYAFQNGPQRVHVALDATPWIATAEWQDEKLILQWHTETLIEPLDSVWMDPEGHVLLTSQGETGLLRDQDLITLLPCFSEGDRSIMSSDSLDSWLNGDTKQSLFFEWREQRWELQRAPLRDEWQKFFKFRAQSSRHEA